MSAEWWKDYSSSSATQTPSIEEMNKVWAKLSPVMNVLVNDITDNAEYWQSVETIINGLGGCRGCPSPINDFQGFVNKLYDMQDKLKATDSMDVISFIVSSPKTCDAMFLIWTFADCFSTPHIFFNAINLMFQNRTKIYLSKKNAIASFPGTLDFLFDHYYPMIESFPLDDKQQMISRINLFQFLSKLLIDYPDKILRFNDFHRLMWTRLLRIMKNSSTTISITAFRTATTLYKATMDRLDGQTQASWMLKLVANNSAPSFLHTPSIRFAMTIKPTEFGFVTLCKTLIEQGIYDQGDLGMMSRILRLPVVKNPTDVFQYLFKTATKHKILGNAASRVIMKPLEKFKDLLDLKTWAPLFIKRSFQFVCFADVKEKYIRRIYLIIRFYANLLTLNIDWISKAINLSASTVVSCNRCTEMLSKRFNITSEIDPKMKDELQKTPIDKIDLKHLLDDVRTTIPLIDEGGGNDNGSGQSSGSSSARSSRSSSRSSSRKPTVAEMRARFRRGEAVNSTTDLDMLNNLEGPPKKKQPPQNVDVDPSETY